MSETDRTRPSGKTRETEDEDARVRAQAGEAATADEEAAAERAGALDPEVERSYKEAIERGADQKGEGRLP
ncbi:MAG TPA: hypothetical protein VGP92_16930 [Acidimicrobiia bacterium]|jgi:hypothetical protein|nr:hypothetical protein [Acidimicrobiia bacterium]